jgi:hypothetical protein
MAQLQDYTQLPDFVDPTSPTDPVLVDHETGALSPPRYPEVFANLQPLPAGVETEPLVNVHKQRLIAAVIKSLVAGQHLANNVSIEVADKKLFQRCLKMRCLDNGGLTRAFSMF